MSAGAGDRLPDGLVAEVKAAARIEDIVAMRVALRRAGRELLGLCPFHDDRRPSMGVRPDRGFYKCHVCGAGGDAIDFIMRADGLEFAAAIRLLADYYNITPRGDRDAPRLVRRVPKAVPARVAGDDARDEAEILKARRILLESEPAAGTLVETYLRGRGIDVAGLAFDVMAQLRFHAGLDYWHTRDHKGRAERVGVFPAMVAPMQDVNGRVRAAHVTYLAPDGAAKAVIPDPDQPHGHPDGAGKFLPAKKMRGRAWGCAIRLGPPTAVMILSEGIENGLSGMVSLPGAGCYVAGSLGNMAGAGIGTGTPHPKKPGRNLPSIYPDFTKPGVVMPAPALCREVVILGERDANDQDAVDAQIDRAARRLHQSGHRVRIAWAPEGMDHNDLLRGVVA